MTTLQLIQLSDFPLLYQVDDFLREDELAHVLRASQDETQLAERGIRTHRGMAGLSCELPVFGDALLEDLRERLQELLGVSNDLGATLRFRRYQAGEQHPRHSDAYEIADRCLVVTALLYLRAPASGGATFFPAAVPAPITIQPRAGRLVLWFNYRHDGTPDPTAEHESLPVRSGDKITLTSFVYKARGCVLPKLVPGAHTRRSLLASGVRFHCVDDGVPVQTTRALRSACTRRGVEYIDVDVRGFDHSVARPLGAGELLYRPAVSLAASRVEQVLYSPQVVSFFGDSHGVFYDCLTPPLVFQRAGLPIPKTIYSPTPDRGLLRRYVTHLGGFPLVVKWLGRSGGVGVLRVDSLAALFSLMDHARASGALPLLCEYIADATHWRLVVIGDRVVASYRNVQARDDFRTYASEEVQDYLATPSAAMCRLAVRAAQVLAVATAGVDILETADGKLYLLEANFPCYFAQAQVAVGVDIAVMMLDYLLQKRSERGDA